MVVRCMSGLWRRFYGKRESTYDLGLRVPKMNEFSRTRMVFFFLHSNCDLELDYGYSFSLSRVMLPSSLLHFRNYIIVPRPYFLLILDFYYYIRLLYSLTGPWVHLSSTTQRQDLGVYINKNNILHIVLFSVCYRYGYTCTRKDITGYYMFFRLCLSCSRYVHYKSSFLFCLSFFIIGPTRLPSLTGRILHFTI